MFIKKISFAILLIILATEAQGAFVRGQGTPVTYSYSLSSMLCRITKTSSQGITQWSVLYDESGVTCKSRFLAQNAAGDLFAIFEQNAASVNPKSIALNTATDAPLAFSKGLFTSYGIGSNTPVSVLVKIDITTGKLKQGTFIMSKDFSGLINNSASYSFVAESLTVAANLVTVTGTGAAFPPSSLSRKNNFVFDNDASFSSQQQIDFTLDLAQIVASTPVEETLPLSQHLAVGAPKLQTSLQVVAQTQLVNDAALTTETKIPVTPIETPLFVLDGGVRLLLAVAFSKILGLAMLVLLMIA